MDGGGGTELVGGLDADRDERGGELGGFPVVEREDEGAGEAAGVGGGADGEEVVGGGDGGAEATDFLREDGEDLAEIGGAVGDEFEDETAVGVAGDITEGSAEEELLVADGDVAAELGVGVGGVVGGKAFVGEFADLFEGREVFEEVAGAGVGATGGVVLGGANEEVVRADGDGGSEVVALGAVRGGEAGELGAGGDGMKVDGTALGFFFGRASDEDVAVEGEGGTEANGGAGDTGDEGAGGGAEHVDATSV